MTAQNAPGQDDLPAADCCGDAMEKMTEECKCCSFVKKHKLVGLLMVAVVILMFLISQIGGILGIIAFFRTS